MRLLATRSPLPGTRRSASSAADRSGPFRRACTEWADLQVPRIRLPDGSSPGGWQTFDRYERRSYELDRLIGQLFLAGVSGRNLERVSAELGGKRVARSTVSRVSQAFEEEQQAINEAPLPAEVATCSWTGRTTRSAPSSG